MSTKQEWGNACWHLIHSISFKLKDENIQVIESLNNYIYNVCINLPCPDCSDHAKTTFAQAKMAGIKVKTIKDLQIFWWKFHNLVNSRLKKPYVTFKDAEEKYEHAILSKIILHFMNIMNRNVPGERSMMYTMSRKTAVKKMVDFIKTHQSSFNIS